MPAHPMPGWAVRPLRHVTRGRAMVAAVLVLSASALWLVLGVSDAATSSDAVPVDAALAVDLTMAAKSCPALTPPRLAAQVMAATGFKPTASGGIAGVTASQWKVWAPSTDADPADPGASILTLAHLTCDLVGQVRLTGVAGDRWRLAVAAWQSSAAAVKDAAGVPSAVAAFVDRVDGYADFYAGQPPLGTPATSAAPLPSATATALPTASDSPAPTPTASPSATGGIASLAKPSPTANPVRGLQLQHDGFTDASGLRLNGSAHVDGGQLALAAGSEQAASAWASSPIDASRSFRTSFTAQISDIADGIAFVVQGQGPTALGSAGGGLGYGGRTGDPAPPIKPSLAVEMDTWDNSPDGFDPAGHQHIAVTTNGDYSNHLIWRDPGFTMWGSGPVYVWIVYDASAHSLTVWAANTPTQPANALFSYPVDLSAVVGTGPVLVGFTASTGMTSVTDAQESILRWSFVSPTG
jgi:Legume lectin domain